MRRPPVLVASPWRALAGALGVLAGVLACSGIITGPDAPDLRPRSMRVTPSAITVALGDTARLTAFLYDVTGAAATPEPGVPLTYVSNDTTIARVDGTGLVTAVAGGSTFVRGVYGALTLGIPVQVTTRPRIVLVSGDAQTAEQGDTLAQPIVVRALDAAGQPVANTAVSFVVLVGGGAVTASTDTTDAAGLAQTRWVLGVPLGLQSLRAERAGSDSLLLSAVASPATTVRRVAVTAARTTLTGVGDTTQLVARAYNRLDSLLAAAPFTWTSGNTAVLTVSGTGLVTSQGTGSAYVRAASGAFADSVQLTVAPVVANGVRRWSGAVSDDWTVAGNWLEGSAPTADDSVVVPATGVTNLPRFTATTFRSLVSLNAGPIVLDGDGAVRVTDALVLRTDVLAASCGVGSGFVLRSPTTDGPHPLAGRMTCGITVEAGDRVLVDSLVLEGRSLALSGTARLTLAGRPVHLEGQQLFVSGAARLEMLQPADRVFALFANLTAAGQGDMFGAGELHLRHGLAVVPGGGDFVTGAAHRVVLTAAVPSDTATLLVTTGVRFGALTAQLPTRIDGAFALAGSLTLGAQGRLIGTTAPSFGLPERLRVGGDFTAAAGATTSVRVVELGGALVAPDFAPDTLVLIGTGQRLPLDGTVTGLRSVRVAAGATATIGTTANTRRTLFGDLTIEGDLGMAESFTVAIGITGSLRVIGNGILRLGGTYSSLRVEGNALFDGRAMNGELATGDLELYGDLVQRATSSSRSLRTAPGFNVTFMRSGAIDFATPDSSFLGTIDHFGNLTRTLRSDLTVQGLVRYDLNNVTVRSDLLGAGGTRTVTAHGLVIGGSTTLRNVAYRVLDGAALTLNGGATFADFDPAAIQLDLVRSSGTVALDFASFTSAPTGTGRYLRASDPNGATGGTFTVNVSNVTPATHQGFAEAVAPAVINGWPSGIVQPTISLGADILHPAGLQTARVARFGAPLTADVRVTVRSLDPAKLLLALDSETRGGDSVQVDAVVGDTAIRFWLQGLEGATTDAALVVTAPGFAPDTQLVTMIRPAMSLLLVTPSVVPTAGGADPALQVVIGYNDEGTLIPMGLRAFGPGAAFTVASQDDEVARVAFNATVNTLGADQPAATSVVFTLRPMRSATTFDTTSSVPASLVVSRTGMPGLVGFRLTADPEWVLLGADPALTVVAPDLVLTPDTLAFTAALGALTTPSLDVDVANATIGEIAGLAAEVQYGAGASDWLTVLFDSVVAPTAMLVRALPEFLPVGTFSANVIVTSTTPGVLPDTIAVSIVVSSVARIVIVSGDSQTVMAGLAAPDSLKVRVLQADGTPLGDAFVGFSLSAGGGTLSPTDEVTDNDGYVATAWTAGTTPGTYTMTASRSGYQSAVFTLTVIPAVVGPPDRIVAVSGDSTAAFVGDPVAEPFVARVVDANGLPVAGVVVGWSAIHGCCNPVASATDTTDANGVVSFSFSMPTVASVVTVQATVAGLTGSPLVFTAFAKPLNAVTALVRFNTGGGQAGAPILPGWTVWAVDQYGNIDTAFTGPITMTLSNGPTNLATLGGTSVKAAVAGVAVFDDLTVNVASSSWVLLASSPGLATTASAAFSISIPVTMTIVGNPVLGVGGTATVRASIPVPSYGTGLVLGLNASNPAIVTVNAPASVTLPVGDTVAFFTITGAGNGSTFLNATIDGSGAGQIPVNVTNQIISLPSTLNVPYGLTTSIPVQLAVPAPAGGLTVALTTSDAARVGVTTPTVFFAAGTTLSSGTLSGVLPGSATISATAAGWVTDTTHATTTLELDVLQQNVNLDASFGTSATVAIRSGGTFIAAPAGGVAITLTARNAACVAVPATVTVTAGATQVGFPVTYGGTAPTPCATYVVASAPNAVFDSMAVSVAVPPFVTAYDVTLGAGTHISTSTNLSSTTFGSTTVHIETLDPSLVLVSPGAATVGTTSIDVPLNAPSASFGYYIAALENVTGTGRVVVSAPGFRPDTAFVTVGALGIEFISAPTSIASFASNFDLQARIGGLNAAGTSIIAEYPLRAGGTPIVVTLANSNATAARLVSSALTGQSVTTTIPVGSSRIPVGLGAGGVLFDPLAAGSTTLTATSPGIAPMPNATYLVTVTTPFASMGNHTLGAGTHLSSSFSLSAPQHGGVTVRIESSDPTRVLVAPDVSTPATPFIDVFVPNGSASAGFYVAALENVTGTSTLTVTAPGFTSAQGTTTVRALGIEWISTPGTTTSLSPNSNLQLRFGGLNAAGTLIETEFPIRTGGTPIVATLTNSNAAAAQLVSSALTGQVVTTTIPVGSSRAPVGVPSGGVDFDPLGAGSTQLVVSSPGILTVPNGTANVTVNAPVVSAGAGTLGAGTQLQTGATFGASQHGGVTVHVESSDPTRVLLALNASSPAVAALDIPLPNGSASVAYHIAALENVTGTSTITVSAPGFVTGTATATVRPLGIEIFNAPSTTTSLSPRSAVQVRIGGLNVAGTSIETEYPLRTGGVPITATIANANGTVGQLVTTAFTGQSVTTVIPVGTSRSPSGVATGGVDFDPLSTGSTTLVVTAPGITTVGNFNPWPITVNTPAISGGNATLGAGTQAFASASLGASDFGTVMVHLESSDPSLVLVAPNAGTVGTASIDVPITAPSQSFSFIIAALEGVTGTATITISAPGFTSATYAVTVRGLGVEIFSLPTSIGATTSGTDFNARVGGLNAAGNTIETEFPLRTGGAPLVVTFDNGNAAVAQLVTTAGTAQSRTVTIPVGQSRTPSGVPAGGIRFVPIAAGTTVVTATVPGVVRTLSGTQTVTVTP